MKFGFNSLSVHAQVATEYLMLVGICLIIIAALTGYSFIQYGDSTSISQSTQAMKEIQESANKVYSLGEGSAVITNISLPGEIISFTASGKSIIMTRGMAPSLNTDVFEFDFNVSGPLPTSQGYHTLVVSNVNGAVVFREI